MLEEYFLLVRRISGLSMSVEDYWELDTWTTSKLLRMEEAIIKEEPKGFNKNNKKHDYVEQPEGNSQEMNNLMDELSIEG